MSLSNSLFDKIIKNKCHHNNIFNKNKSYHKSYFYCYKCNNIILIDNNKLYCTYKLLSEVDNIDMNDKVEFDPITIVKQMIQRQEEQIKDINDKLVLNYLNNEEINTNNNINDNENINRSGITSIGDYEEKEKIKNLKTVNSELMSLNNSIPQKNSKNNNKLTKLLFDDETFEKYSKQRNKVLIYVHRLCTKLKYNDCSFYLSLYLLDTYLSRIFSEDITERELFLVVLGFFLISSKYIEDDIFEPELQIFCNIEKSILLTVDEIRSSEVQCLTLVNYNLYLYSAYDWLNILLSNGILFENEIKDINELANIYLYTQRLLTILTSKIIFCKYSSIQIAFSIVHLSREKFLHKNLETSQKLFKLLISLYGIDFSDYEECYIAIKKDINQYNESEDEQESSNKNTNTNSKTNINTQSIEIKSSNINNIMNDEKDLSNTNSSGRENKFKIYLNSNKDKKYINTDININNINKNSKQKYKLYASPGQTNFANHKKKAKSNEKNYEFLSNNSIGLFPNDNKKSPNILTHNNSSNNNSFKSTNFIPKETQHLMIDCYRNDKQLILSNKNKKDNNTLYINYEPKFLIKNTKTNINNINYINNININNEIINLFSGNKKKKMHKNISSGLNLNYGYKINDNKKNKNNENKINNFIINKAILTMGNSNQPNVNYEYNINNINNNKIKKENYNNIHITTSQNIIAINNDITNSFKNPSHNKLDPNKKEKYKTHLLLDVSSNPPGLVYNRNESNQFIVPPEKENKSCNKYSFNGYNYINNDTNNDNNKKKNKLKLHLNRKNEIKVMNTNININLVNKFSNRKFTLNFKDIVNKKTKMERPNNFISKEKKSNMKRFKSLNSNNYMINKNKEKENKIYNFNENKSSNDKVNIFIQNKNEKKDKRNIPIESNILNYKNLAQFNSRLPKLKLNKNIFNSGK